MDSDYFYRLLFDAHPQPMLVYDQQTLRFLTANEAAVRLYGYDRDEFSGMTLNDIAADAGRLQALEVPAGKKTSNAFARPGDWRHRTKSGMTILVHIVRNRVDWGGRAAVLMTVADTDGRPSEVEHRLGRKDGPEGVAREPGEGIRDAQSRPLRLLGVPSDVTERKAAEETARTGESWLRAILDAALDGIVSMDEKGAILDLNPAAEKIFGYRRADVIGRRSEEILIPEARRASFRTVLAMFLSPEKKPATGRRMDLLAMRSD